MNTSELIERAARQMWKAREAGFPPRVRRMEPDETDKATGAWMLMLLQAEAALGSLAPDDPHILDRLSALASGEAWVAPNESSEAMRNAAALAAHCDHAGDPRVWAAERAAHLSACQRSCLDEVLDAVRDHVSALVDDEAIQADAVWLASQVDKFICALKKSMRDAHLGEPVPPVRTDEERGS